MAISYHIDRDLALLTVEAVGEIAEQDIQQYKTALTDDPDLRSVTREICDIREAALSISPTRMAEVAGLHRDVFAGVGSTMCAVIVSSDLLYGLLRMYAQCVGPLGHEVLPFRDIAEARKWLGLPESGEDA